MIDVEKQTGSVHRAVATRDVPEGETRVLTISQVYDTDIDDLWSVVTTAERIPRWFMPIEGDLEEGGRYQLTGNAGGTVTRCDAPNGFAATWEYGETVSWIEVRLTAEGAGRTRLELDHLSRVADDKMWEQFGPGAAGMGWDSGLLGLALHLSSPDSALKPETAMAWLATDEGKLFLRLSGDAWAEAAIADGEDPQVARDRAEACYKAYTGEA